MTRELDTTPQSDELARQKRELVNRLLRKKRGAAARLALEPRDRSSGPAPLSSSQEGLWLLDRLYPGRGGNNNMLPVRFEGALDVAVLTRVLEEILRRHEVLRSALPEHEGHPVQVVLEEAEVELVQHDFRGRPYDAGLLQLRELEAPFDLETGPLFRLNLLRTEDDAHLLLISIHHIAFDGLSASVLYNELCQLYAAFAEGRPSPLPALRVQYADFADWERRRLQGESLETELSWWRNRLEGAEELELPVDDLGEQRPGQYHAIVGQQLPRALSDSLRELSRVEGVTPFATMLAVFQLLLQRYSGQDDIVVGTPVTQRRETGLESLIGLFVNMVVLRSDFSGAPSFQELLRRVWEMASGAVSHGALPFEVLVQALKPRRHASRNPIFQTSFTLERVGEEVPAVELPGLRVSVQSSTTPVSVFDLEAFVGDRAEGMFVELKGRQGLFDAATLERMLGHYRVLLEAVVADPRRPISELRMLAPAERDRLLVEHTQTNYPRATVSELFALQVTRAPEKAALCHETEALSYSELDQRANQLARHLVRIGVEPGARVGICLERGIDMVVGLLGVLRAGAAYVPLDPGYPADRIAFMLEDSAAPVLLTQEALRDALPTHAARVVCLDGDRHAIAKEPATAPELHIRPEDVAYVIYTSGSTGRPKGVQIPHRALSNFLHAMADRPGLGPDDVLVAVTTLCFDIAMLELLLPLVVGGRAVVASREDAVDPVRLARLLQSSGATKLQATPATWRMLVSSGWLGLPQLDILCGGEALPRDLADELLSRGRSVWNLYGPTESTIWSTVCRVAPGKGAVPIGEPIANTRVYVLDAALEPVPVGVPGELYIGGEGVALGYLDRPELTRERFVPDPFAATQDAHLYRTGDRARLRSDGQLEYLGRLDNQVKLRGFRIELGEVEATLRAHAGVREAAAIVREDAPGDARLTAYVVPADDDTISAQDLRELARVSLPEYMVPSAIVSLDALPQTPNGKLDRRALPAPERGSSELAYVAPRSEAEALMVELWRDVLGLDQISVYDHFFDLGGHSMLTLSVITKFEEKTGFRLDPVGFFQQTLAQLAASYERLDASVEPATAADVSGCRLEPFFMASGGRQLFALERVATRPRGRGVLLCHPHAHEYDRCHRAYRELALQLARRGYDTLSFDYTGCGDSEGSYDEARLADWSADVSAAMDVLKRRGLERIAVIGTRLGATLAMLAAAEREDVDALVLWQPVVHGPSLVEEYDELAGGGLEVAGYPLTEELAKDLSTIDLTRIRTPAASRVLVLENASVGDEALREFAAGLPVGAEYRLVGDAGVWLRDLYESVVPVTTVQAVVGWLEEVYP